jgi:hypothetical protein
VSRPFGDCYSWPDAIKVGVVTGLAGGFLGGALGLSTLLTVFAVAIPINLASTFGLAYARGWRIR